jgi:hypothetical protein
MEIFNKNELEINGLEERSKELKSNKCYNELNGLLFSPKCIYFYVVLIITSVLIFIYSIFAYFFKLGKKNNNFIKKISLDERPIITIETILCLIVITDMLIRTYINVKIIFK